MDKEMKEMKEEELDQVAGGGIYTDMSKYTAMATSETGVDPEISTPFVGQTNQYQLMMQKKKDEDYMQSLLIPAK